MLSEEDFELAVSSLEVSTASLEKHCQLLAGQKQPLQDIKVRNISNRNLEAVTIHPSSKFARENEQLEFEASEISESLQSRLRASLKQAESATNNMQNSADKVLEKDDRLLDGLEKIIPQVASTDDSAGDSDEIEQLCQALIMQSSSEIHSRLDTTYNTTVQQYGTKLNGAKNEPSQDDQRQQRDALRLELEELSREIEGLSTMVVDTQYRSPISRAVQGAREGSDAERNSWSDYVQSALEYLTARLETIDSHFQHIHAHNTALKTVSTAVDAITAVSMNDKKQAKSDEAYSTSKSSQKGLKPLRLVQANLSDLQDPVSQLLRQVDVQNPNVVELSKLAETLPKAVKQKNEKFAALLANNESSISNQIGQSLAKVGGDSESVVGAVFANSNFGIVDLMSNAIERGVNGLEEKIQRLGSDMRDLDMGDVTGNARKRQQSLLKMLGQ